MVSTYRDRTSESRSFSETLQKIGGIAAVHHSHNAHSPSRSPLPSTSGSEFGKKASRIGSGINETTQKISRLAQLGKKSTMFNDPTREIQELTALVKKDITTLDVALTDLHTIQNMEIADGNYSQDEVVHSTAVCDDLKSRLMGATKELQDVLTTRTQKMKAHENRKQYYSTSPARANPFKSPAKTVTEPPPWSAPSSGSSSGQPSQSSTEVQVGNQLRRRLAGDNPPSQQMEMSMLQQVVPRQENYTESRATALQNVESTISELSGVFTHLATMVAHQGELAISKIDDNMEESLTNVEGAHSALLRNLNRISSTRWLIIKIFFILIFFLIVFIFFVAQISEQKTPAL